MDYKHYRDAMARLGAAVNIVTTGGAAGWAGFTATAVCSVTDTPPTLLVCINRASSAYEAVHTNGVVCINVLSAEHRELARIFGGGTPGEERFASGDWTLLDTGAPALVDAVASLDCHITQIVNVGTHDILICNVARIEMTAEPDALAYFDRDFHILPRDKNQQSA